MNERIFLKRDRSPDGSQVSEEVPQLVGSGALGCKQRHPLCPTEWQPSQRTGQRLPRWEGRHGAGGRASLVERTAGGPGGSRPAPGRGGWQWGRLAPGERGHVGGLEHLRPVFEATVKGNEGSAGLTVQENSGAWTPPWDLRAVIPWLSLRDMEASAAAQLNPGQGGIRTIRNWAFPLSSHWPDPALAPGDPPGPYTGAQPQRGLHPALAQSPPLPGYTARSHLTSCNPQAPQLLESLLTTQDPALGPPEPDIKEQPEEDSAFVVQAPTLGCASSSSPVGQPCPIQAHADSAAALFLRTQPPALLSQQGPERAVRADPLPNTHTHTHTHTCVPTGTRTLRNMALTDIRTQLRQPPFRCRICPKSLK